ncbi:zf-HC2 domain-containing protein [Luedemannella helvata]|uniref:Zf-HC2 domain-containing protein n=1 Tax=Luedemannella helvata TaxID=349315 RepID=A0ABN2K794_9ACTN
MGCEDFREALSARLDGEAEPVGAAVTDAHLAGCPDCAAWYDAAAGVTRLARLRVAEPEPVLSATALAAVLDAVPPPSRGKRLRLFGPADAERRRRRATVLWRLLGCLGAAQFLLGVAQIGSASAGHVHAGGSIGGGVAAGVTAGHLWHESAAWNVAIGAAFGWIALRRLRPAGSLPILTAFLAVLALVSIGDALGGKVAWTRLASHGVLVAGYLILLGLGRLDAEGRPPGARAGGTPRWRVQFDEPSDGTPPAALLRLPTRRTPPPATAEATRHAA